MWLMLANLLGGMGLFAVGIHLLSEGFQTAAGYSLRRLLAEYTDSTLKGILAGTIVATLVQSSSAVIVTIIGFINSRMIKLKEAITVVFGANLGKVATIWLIATLGFKWDFSHYGLYLVGLAALVQSLFLQKKSGLMLALMGFGVLLFGVYTLKLSMNEVNQSFHWETVAHPGLFGMVFYFLLGAAMSIVMQSSTAAIVITFSALDANIFTLANATAMVIGQNLGSISSSILASMGTTPVAKRLTAVHTLFNLVVTLVSLLLLSSLIMFANHQLFLNHKVISVTSFYSVAIGLSLLILLPLRNVLVDGLKKYFTDSRRMGTPKFIQDSKTISPQTAVMALRQEVWHFARLSTEILSAAVPWRFKQGWVQTIDLSQQEREMDMLVDDIHWFASKASRKHAELLDIKLVYYGLSLASRHFENVCDLSKKITGLKAKFSEKIVSVVFEEILAYTDNLMEFIFLISDVREVSDEFLFPELEEFLAHAKQQKTDLEQKLLHASSSKEILYSDAILLLEISDLAYNAVSELYLGTHNTLDALKHIPKEFITNVIPLKMNLATS